MSQATDLRKPLKAASKHIVVTTKKGEIIDAAASSPKEREDWLNNPDEWLSDPEKFKKIYDEVE